MARLFVDMRSRKRQSSRVSTPTVNSYTFHLAAVKSLLPDRATQRPIELRLSRYPIKANTDPLRAAPTRQDGRPAEYCTSLHTPVHAFVNEFVGPEQTLLRPPPAGTVVDGGAPAHRAKAQRALSSAGLTCSLSKARPLLHTVGDALTMNVRSTPALPVALRSREDCSAGLERLDLDHRRLTVCPSLDSLDKLRLLNLQHNLISQLPHLAHLQCLAILDLYNNRLTDMSAISSLSSLHVLMLGMNRIQRICGLDNLSKLDVLDLHSNQISVIENVSHLSELRVLNLAGNHVSRVENLQGLDSLTELNLRCNCISTVTEVDRLPCLQRLFLSTNSICSFDELACLGDSCSLSELTLDGNPVAQESCYKQITLRCLLPLRLLDMKRITEEERRAASLLVRKEDEKKRESHKHTAHKEKRRLAIRNAAQQWEGSKACLELPAQNGAKEELSPENSPAHSPAQTNGLAQDPSPDELRRERWSPLTVPERPAGGGESRLRSASRPNSPRDPRLQDTGGASVQSLSLSESHVAELDGETVRLFGPGALEALERGWGVQTAGAVTTIAFRYILFDSIAPTLPRVRLKFPNLTHLIFMETNITRLQQLSALGQVRRLEQVTIHPDGNPVVGLTLWRAFLIYRLNHLSLQKINGTEVTTNDIMASERVFGSLGYVASTETPRCRLLLLLEESRKRQLQFLLEGRGRRVGLSPEEIRENGKLLGESMSRTLFNYPSRDASANSPEAPQDGGEGGEALERVAGVERYLRGLGRGACYTSLKGEALQKLWPTVFVEMVRDCVLEMRDMPTYRHTSLSRLAPSK
ncbi:leucine-rich repeat-containing protein 49 [Brachyhypopomus gauderio]|uniref:leucine-rich repeat-containing protein 49 n=1 Tax=Brachyhypopomus gauderio TaxID=698409 RepID=UPI004040F396